MANFIGRPMANDFSNFSTADHLKPGFASRNSDFCFLNTRGAIVWIVKRCHKEVLQGTSTISVNWSALADDFRTLLLHSGF